MLRLASGLAFLALAAGCGGERGLTVEVTPETSLADEPVHIVVRGARRPVLSIELRSTDSTGRRWRSTAWFRAGEDGTVDLDRAPATAGDYAGVWSAGLLHALRPPREVGAYAWAGPRPLEFEVVVDNGTEVARATFRRRYSLQRLRRTPLSLDDAGLVGVYVTPEGVRRRPAVLLFGGSEGSLSPLMFELAGRLAAHGYPALAVAYFGEAGLPQSLHRVPLEYFAGALRWLAQRPEVEPTRLLTFGYSRGSEAALLLGVHYPRLVYGVVASMPSNVALYSAWTLGGRVVPSTTQANTPRPTDEPRAVIPVERIRGPVLAYCASNDVVWASCPYARAIADRRRRHDRPYTFHEMRGASHYAGAAAPYAIWSFPRPRREEQAVAAFWPRLLAFLEDAKR